jgi:large subunit ribosomal protein L11
MAKQAVGRVKLRLLPGKATPAPPVGSTLGQRGINIMDFCKDFNARTKSMDPSLELQVKLVVFSDKSFKFVVKKPSAAKFILQTISLQKGSSEPGKKIVKTISRKDLLAIAEKKMSDLNCYDVEAALMMLIGTAKSIGIDVVD